MKICIDPYHGMINRQTGIYEPGATHLRTAFSFKSPYHTAILRAQHVLSIHVALYYPKKTYGCRHASLYGRPPAAGYIDQVKLLNAHMRDEITRTIANVVVDHLAKTKLFINLFG